MSKRLHHTVTPSPTLADVARAAKVSTATVSRVLNTPDAVRGELRDRVREHIKRLGYVADGAARALASRRSRTIGAVIPTLASAIFAEGMDAFEARLGESGHALVLAQSGYDATQELRHVQNLVERGVDAVLLVGSAHDPAILALLQRRAIPYVETWTHRAPPLPDAAEGAETPCVGFNNVEAARRMAAHLLDLGHREIAMVAGIAAGNDRATERIAGVRQALAAQGIALRPERLIECKYDIAAGRRAARRLLAQNNPPTAIICGNDVLALGALLECQATGIQVPERLSITGFDDLPITRHMTPALTTMRVPSSEMGRCAAEYLLARLAGEAPPPSTELDVELIVRASTAPPARSTSL